ncbi:jg5141 [Pararge aegeria aegeria]|uniref:Jg5141 protein n=1 Tax=Pararge aegeria aegeria TaxID=348720 RepID=A0A8S4S469_9NEOP|nr:jg5141 [Pararge aegeria aegeria]
MFTDIKKRLIKSYIWSIALYACETWIMTQRKIERRRMERISWTEKIGKKELLTRVDEKRNIEIRRGKIISHL